MVLQKASHLFGRDKDIKVTGVRLSPLEAKQIGLPSGTYLTECSIRDRNTENMLVVTAHSHDWRAAYKKLKLVVEQTWETSYKNRESI